MSRGASHPQINREIPPDGRMRGPMVAWIRTMLREAGYDPPTTASFYRHQQERERPEAPPSPAPRRDP